MNNLKDIKWYATVKMKMISLLIFTVTTVTIIVGIFSFNYIKEIETSKLTQFANVTADRLSKSLETPMWNIDKELVSDLLATELGLSTIVGIVVNDQGNQGVMSAKSRIQNNQIIDFSGSFDPLNIKITRNIVREGTSIGSLELYVTRDELAKSLDQFALGIIALIIILAIAILIIMNVLLNSIVINPLIKLADTADAISLGRLDQNFEVNSKDEIGFLADSFKKMQVSLRIAMTRISKNPKSANAQSLQKSTFDQAVIKDFIRKIKSADKFPSLPSIFEVASKANTVPDDLVEAAWQEWKQQGK
jgi:methyl-accepting chemotaxis protein